METFLLAAEFQATADDYDSGMAILEEAVEKAKSKLLASPGILRVSIVYDYEYDNDGQRVLYLPAVDEASDDWDDGDDDFDDDDDDNDDWDEDEEGYEDDY